MIKNIIELKNILSFLDFSASEIEFSKKNILYAPNGTGKTNISRVFNRLSKNESLDDFLSQESSNLNSLEFKIKYGDFEISKTNLESHKLLLQNIYVFNSDYIEETLKIQNFSEIDVSGEVNIPIGKKSNKIIELEKDIEVTRENRKNLKDKISSAITQIKENKVDTKEYSLQDINIWKELIIDNLIDKTFILNLPQDNKDFIDCEEKFKRLSKIDESTSIDYSKLLEVNKLNIDFKDIQVNLDSPKNFKIFDEGIKENIEQLTKDWIETKFIKKGVELSQEKETCILCKRDIDDSVDILFNDYKAYFENEESKFKDKLYSYSKDINALKEQLLKINNNLEIEINDYAKLFNINRAWQKLNTEIILKKLDELEIAIQKKRINLGFRISVSDNDGHFYDFSKKIDLLNISINDNVDLAESILVKFTKVKEEKTKFRTLIGRKFLFEFYRNNKSDFDKILVYNKNIHEFNKELLIEKASLPTTKVSSNIEWLCNIFLHDFLYITKYEVEDKSGILLLKLNSHDISKTTQKISEGEKTMISLAFYLASSVQKFNSFEKFSNAVFIIDDPVNSTSYNYFFGVCNLLKFFETSIVSKLWKDDLNKLNLERSKLQKIILTHNTQFFNVLRENVFKGKNDKFFLLSDKNILEIPKNYLKSEFELALTRIKEAVEKKDFHNPVGNELRRVFETIRHFYGFEAFNAETLKLIFQEFQEKKHHIFFNVVNYYSHGNPEAHTDPLSVNFGEFLTQFEMLIKESQFKELWGNIKIQS